MVEWVMRVAREKADSEHHRLPQFYLRGFAGKQGRLKLLDPTTGETRSEAPKNTFVEEGYYTIEDEQLQRLALAEVAYEDIENHASRVHRLLLGGTSPAELNVEQRSYYAFLLGVQITRAERFRAMDAEMADKLGKTMLQMKAAHADSWWDRFQADTADSEEDLDVSRDQFVEFVERGEYTLSHPKAFTANLSLSVVRDLADVFFHFDWHVVHFEEPCLFTAEEPISYWVPPERSFPERGIGPLTSNEVRFPMSPNAALILTHPGLGYADRAGTAGAKVAAWLNYWTWAFHGDRTLVLSPDTPSHPFPVNELIPMPGLDVGVATRPIIDR
jgi:hypothetical protein